MRFYQRPHPNYKLECDLDPIKSQDVVEQLYIPANFRLQTSVRAVLFRLDKLAFFPLFFLAIVPVISCKITYVVTPIVLLILAIMHNSINSSINDAYTELEQMKSSLDIPNWFNDCLDIPLIDPTISQTAILEIEELSKEMLWTYNLIRGQVF